MKLNIGKAIIYFRKSHNMTQADLADITGIPQPNISQIERDKRDPSPKNLERIAYALGVTPKDIKKVALDIAQGHLDNKIDRMQFRNHDTDFYISDGIIVSVRSVIHNIADHKLYHNTIISKIIEQAIYQYINEHYDELNKVILNELHNNKELIEDLLNEIKNRR